MKTVQVKKGFGDRDVLQIVKTPVPSSQPHEIIIKIHYAGVNFVDVAMRRGWFLIPPNPFQFMLGTEVAGEITAVGSGVVNLKVGERVE